MQQHQVPYGTFKELSEQRELIKDILQRVILPAKFEAATPSKSKFICMWIDALKNAVAYVMFYWHHKPTLKIEHSIVYPGMIAGVCWPALSRSPIAVPFPV